MDLSRALLSPKRLGPETESAPVPIEARTDRKQVKTERVIVPKVAERVVVPEIAERPKAVAQRKTRTVQDQVEKPRGLPAPNWRDGTAIRSMPKHAIRESRPAPCKSGAICGWQNQPSPDSGWAPLQGVTYR